MILIRENSLVLYKQRPARLVRLGEKIELELEGGETQKVRLKDVALLHPGPIRALSEALRPQSGEVETAWEMLAGGTTTLPELADLAYGAYTAATAWATWQLIADGLYFRGEPEQISVCTAAEVARVKDARAADAAEKQAWLSFLAHVRAGHLDPEDGRFLRDVESLALERAARSRVLRELGREETPENAHALLLALDHWTPSVNPYPTRLGVSTAQPDLPVSALPEEPRRDLTHLPAFAIDAATTDTPDDALSFAADTETGGGRLWIHVADPAAVAPPGSPLDLEARGRGASLYLPEGAIAMLPPATTPLLGLGLSEVSPALSFGLEITADGQIAGIEIVPSWVHVARLTYEEATARIAEAPFAALYALAQTHRARRLAAGAVDLKLPEVDVTVVAGRVVLCPVPRQPSRIMVENAMIMAGEAIAAFALAHEIPVPFATQEASDTDRRGEWAREAEGGAEPPAVALSAMFALRKTLKRSQYRATVAPHSGLGLAAYTQVTSPMRRYLDLVTHQQLRAYLRGEQLLTADEILERVGATEAVIGSIRQAENLSNQHWTLVYLLQNPDWRGEGVIVEHRERNSVVLIPELGLEPHLHLSTDLPLDSSVTLRATQVDLPRRDVRFRV